MSAIKHLQNYIDGQFIAPIEGKYLNNVNPATGKVNNQVPNSTEKDVEKAVHAAKKAFESWKAVPKLERASYLYRIAEEIEKRKEELIEADSKDMGKPYSDLKNVDIAETIAQFKLYANAYSVDTTQHFQSHDMFSIEHRDPVGVVGLISPWNYPIMLIAIKIAPAIVCGNTCVVKPSELAPTSTYLLCQILETIGLPKGVVNVVHGLGASAGEPMFRNSKYTKIWTNSVTHKDVRAISFTGGCVTGGRICGLASPMMKKLQMELGGKNPSIVFRDCDWDKTIEGVAFAGLFNTVLCLRVCVYAGVTMSIACAFQTYQKKKKGQVCTAGSRVFVEESVFEKFTQSLVEYVDKTYIQSKRIGDPTDANTIMGPLVSYEHRQKVEKYVELAKKEGGKIILGGRRPDHEIQSSMKNGAFFLPTVIVGLNPLTSKCATEEIFGPVITIHSFKTEKEVIQYANAVQYGLAASVWTQDVQKAYRVAREIETGTVWINCWEAYIFGQPFGGVKTSGIGREGGKYSLDFFSQIKPIVCKL
ncbi:hypothetical protein RFI_21772 [Reticulomyxa filosa]|uniref:Aldehyde dehydrogenase domain-containing protein n=1 Tax=Reticulomyxa filosa TaxID=46433 RepID=X6MNL5_RETFI|nr:hypothetical protein RFI_21772 [Reticulomyxa filosa]|eukprot:ETO15593.1 hypothetical protein RFI_21772 [Reticulomyxa filosa]